MQEPRNTDMNFLIFQKSRQLTADEPIELKYSNLNDPIIINLKNNLGITKGENNDESKLMIPNVQIDDTVFNMLQCRKLPNTLAGIRSCNGLFKLKSTLSINPYEELKSLSEYKSTEFAKWIKNIVDHGVKNKMPITVTRQVLMDYDYDVTEQKWTYALEIEKSRPALNGNYTKIDLLNDMAHITNKGSLLALFTMFRLAMSDILPTEGYAIIRKIFKIEEKRHVPKLSGLQNEDLISVIAELLMSQHHKTRTITVLSSSMAIMWSVTGKIKNWKPTFTYGDDYELSNTEYCKWLDVVTSEYVKHVKKTNTKGTLSIDDGDEIDGLVANVDVIKGCIPIETDIVKITINQLEIKGKVTEQHCRIQLTDRHETRSVAMNQYSISINATERVNSHYQRYDMSQIKIMSTINDKGYQDRVIWPTLILTVALASLTLIVIVSSFTKQPWITTEGVDPSSLTSMTIVLEGIVVAIYVATYKDNWSLYDMVRGRLYVEEYAKTSKWFKKKYPPAMIVKHIYNNINSYTTIIHPHGLCLSPERLSGKILAPEIGGDVVAEDLDLSVMIRGKTAYISDMGLFTPKVTNCNNCIVAEQKPDGKYHVSSNTQTSSTAGYLPIGTIIIGIDTGTYSRGWNRLGLGKL